MKSVDQPQDFYYENGLMVFTAAYHEKRGYCCQNGCRHCPYGFKKIKVSISWSGGKDSAFALYKILLSGKYDVVSLHTVIGRDTGRVGLHGIREELIELQAKAIGLPLDKIYLESADDHSAYERSMKEFYKKAVKHIDAIVFGDIYLEDLKYYREKLLEPSGITGIYPLWKIDTNELIQDFITIGFKTAICSCNEELHRLELLSQVLDEQCVQLFPPTIDPCGERGEFHTFVFDGPIFKNSISFGIGGKVSKTYCYKKMNDNGAVEELNTIFWFQDFLPLIAS